MSSSIADIIRFDADGLVPAIVQDAVSGDVLMLAFMNDEALRLTTATGLAHYWSRSRRQLWRKGETSGHTQAVDEIRVNCEQNSLLLLVRQTGAVCHDGYPTCYYRRVAEDGALTEVRARAFDPAAVYHRIPEHDKHENAREIDALAEATRQQFGAYAYLRDNDLTAESSTSRWLRAADCDAGARIGDELRELAGVLDGSHRHADPKSDLCLEASQVIYWVLLQALRHGVTWAKLRPDRALTVDDVKPDQNAIARLLRAEAEFWTQGATGDDIAAVAHGTLALTALACRGVGLDPLDAVESDLVELRSRPYLAPYFSHEDASHDRAPGRARNSPSKRRPASSPR
jgi:phosphoribosyl-AMP cyclohydrolase